MTLHCYLSFYLDSTWKCPLLWPQNSRQPWVPTCRGQRGPWDPCNRKGLCASSETSFLSLMYSDSLLPQGLCISIPLLPGSSLDLHRAAAPPAPLHPHTHTQTLPPVTSHYSPLLPLCCWCLFVDLAKLTCPVYFLLRYSLILLPCRMWILSRLEPWPSPFSHAHIPMPNT